MPQGLPRLILLEGIPGSGKSTTAHFLARHLAGHGVPLRWWYEEEKGHPLYIFDDLASLRKVLADLFSGDQRRVAAVVEAVLAKWRTLGDVLSGSDRVVILDGCLLGYLTWTLFPADVPHRQIHDYARRVADVIRPHRPWVVRLYEADVARALRRICARRGGSTEEHFVRRATGLPYGRRRGLQGFHGLVAYWTEFDALTDAILDALDLPTISIETSAGDWPAYYRQITARLGLPPPPEAGAPEAPLTPFVGTYTRREGQAATSCRVELERGQLWVTGLPHVWPHNRLIATGSHTFAVESLPFRVRFEVDRAGAALALRAWGAELLEGKVDGVFIRDGGAPEPRVVPQRRRSQEPPAP